MTKKRSRSEKTQVPPKPRKNPLFGNLCFGNPRQFGRNPGIFLDSRNFDDFDISSCRKLTYEKTHTDFGQNPFFGIILKNNTSAHRSPKIFIFRTAFLFHHRNLFSTEKKLFPIMQNDIVPLDAEAIRNPVIDLENVREITNHHRGFPAGNQTPEVSCKQNTYFFVTVFIDEFSFLILPYSVLFRSPTPSFVSLSTIKGPVDG
jgi:hypothetical protein